MYWREQSKQLSLDGHRRVCPVCRTLDPPTEPAYGCPECGEGGTLSWYDGNVPEVCPVCGDGKLELVTENACAECGQAEVEEREVHPCPYCDFVRLSVSELHACPNRPTQSEGVKAYREGDWTPGSDGKVAYLRLECRAKDDRVRVGFNRRRCPGWRKIVERYYAGDKNAFRVCVECAYEWGNNPGQVEATSVEPHTHQTVLKV